MSSGTVSFTLVENLHDNADSFHREGINNTAGMVCKEKGGMLSFYHPNYVKILYCIARRQSLSTPYLYCSNS